MTSIISHPACRGLLIPLILLSVSRLVPAQVVTTEPKFPTIDDDITVTFNAAEGNKGLLGVPPPIYAHAGVITDKSINGNDWKYVQGVWGTADPQVLMTTIGPNLYSIAYNIKDFYGIPDGEKVLKLAFVFRNADGSQVGRATDGSDIFIDVFDNSGALFTVLQKPTVLTQVVSAGAVIPVLAESSKPATLSLLDNGNQLYTTTGTTLSQPIFVAGTGFHEVFVIAEAGMEADTQRFTYTILTPTQTEEVPDGLLWGANHVAPGEVTLKLYAPGKNHAYVLCNLNGYTFQPAEQMKRDPDGETWWLTLAVPPGVDLLYQYAVNGTIRVADPYSELILDPQNDGGVPASTFPDIPAYPFGLVTGHLSWVRMDPPEYNWQVLDFQRPDPDGLVVYELLLRDFTEARNYTALLDTLDYLDRLGVTAVELMPVCEFEGNQSWGYNVSYHGALDKYYGTPEALKALVDACHARGMAVILDVVYNHAFGQSPLCRLYWDAANDRPSADSPYANPVAKHPYNVGYDLNHESPATKAYVMQTLDRWLEAFRVDGFRFDLSKGFTQNDSGTDVWAWGQYDASRIAILKDYADHIWSVSPEAYVILEHFAVNTEEQELTNYGMMTWGNATTNYGEAAMGYSGNDLRGVTHKSRGFTLPRLVGYMESHDEERLMFKVREYGNGNGGYSVKDWPEALDRVALASAFFLTLPGPKMLWQFGEVGYDYSIFTCEDGTTVIDPDCKLSPKPVRWDYAWDPDRRGLYRVVRGLNHLRKTRPVFTKGDWDNLDLNQGYLKALHLTHPDMDAVVIGNFGITDGQLVPGFPHTGWWYDYFAEDSLFISDVQSPVDLGPGEYHLFTSAFVPFPEEDFQSATNDPVTGFPDLTIVPNPAAGPWMAILRSDRPQSVRLTLADASGREVLNQQLDLGRGETLWSGPADLAPGVYWLSQAGPAGVRTVPVIRMAP